MLVLLPAAFILALLSTAAVWRLHVRRWRGNLDVGELVQLGLGVAGIFAGIAVLSVFGLTWPPALEHLDEIPVKVTGCTDGFPMLVYAWKEVRPRLFPKRVPLPLADASGRGTRRCATDWADDRVVTVRRSGLLLRHAAEVYESELHLLSIAKKAAFCRKSRSILSVWTSLRSRRSSSCSSSDTGSSRPFPVASSALVTHARSEVSVRSRSFATWPMLLPDHFTSSTASA